MTTEESWAAYLAFAKSIQPVEVPTAPAVGVVGRSLAFLATRMADFYGRHSATINPWLSQLAIAALQAVVANLANIQSLDPPGPE